MPGPFEEVPTHHWTADGRVPLHGTIMHDHCCIHAKHMHISHMCMLQCNHSLLPLTCDDTMMQPTYPCVTCQMSYHTLGRCHDAQYCCKHVCATATTQYRSPCHVCAKQCNSNLNHHSATAHHYTCMTLCNPRAQLLPYNIHEGVPDMQELDWLKGHDAKEAAAKGIAGHKLPITVA